MKRTNYIIFVFFLICGVFASGSALAATKTTSYYASTFVNPQCNVSTAQLVAGIYQSNQPSDLTATGFITVNCGVSIPYSVDLSQGNNWSGSSRRLSNGSGGASDFLSYQLFWTCNGCTIAGVPAGGSTDSGSGTGSNFIHNVYLKIPSYQTVNPGVYSDAVMVTVSY